MKKYFFILIILNFWVSLISVNFVFAGIGLTVPVTDSQLQGVNAVLDAIETTLAEHLKNIDLNLYNLLRIQFEDFFRRNYQDKILQIWEIQHRIDDLNVLLKDLNDESKQKVNLDEYILNAEYAAAYRTITDLPNQIPCLPIDYRSLAEEYVSSTFALYDLSKYALSKLNLIPDCGEVQPDFGYSISFKSPENKPKGFLTNALATVLRPFSLGQFMLAVNPADSSFSTFTISSGYSEDLEFRTIDSFYNVVSQRFAANLDLELGNLPDPRNVPIPAVQVFTDSKKPITLQFQPSLDYNQIRNQVLDLNSYLRKTFSDYDIAFALATDTFTSSTAKDICQKFGLVKVKQGGSVDPIVGCVQSIMNFSTDLKSALLKDARRTQTLKEKVGEAWEEARRKAEQLKASTSPECAEAIKRAEEIIARASSSWQHLATVTWDINEAIIRLTDNQVDINNTIQTVSTTLFQIHEEYRSMIDKINEVLRIFKQIGLRQIGPFKGLPWDFLQNILGELEGHNTLLVLMQSDKIVNNINQILRSADRITELAGASTNVFEDLRMRLAKGAKPITNLTLLKDRLEIYGIKVELANLERQQSCRNEQTAMRSGPKIYAFKGDFKKIVMSDKRVIRKIETANKSTNANDQNKNFFQKLMANFFSPKIIEVNLR